MIKLDSPYLEMGFYFSSLSGDEALANAFRVLIRLGATCEGKVGILYGQQIRHQMFSGVNDEPLSSRKVRNAADVEILFANEDFRVMQLAMRTPPNWPSHGNMILTQLSIAELAKERDQHPIAIWLDGALLSRPPGPLSKKIQNLGAKTREAFAAMVAIMKPDYAAITVDWKLETPAELQDDHRTLAFRDFYLSEARFGTKALTDLQEHSPQACHQQLQHGLMTLSSDWLAPEGRGLPREPATELSRYVGQVIVGHTNAEYWKRGLMA